MGAPKDEKTDIAMVVWLIRGGGRNILFDSGFHREVWLKSFPTADYLRPDEAVKLAGVKPEEVTDIVVSHAHWDHMGGIDLFPKATVWIQKQEFAYYTGEAWQPGGKHGGIDPDDVKVLVQLNTEGRLRLVDGDNVEILPGIRAYTGARHTFASQYIRVEGDPSFVLASDNCYLYRNLAEHKASATFSEADQPANIQNQAAHDRARRARPTASSPATTPNNSKDSLQRVGSPKSSNSAVSGRRSPRKQRRRFTHSAAPVSARSGMLFARARRPPASSPGASTARR